MAVDLPIRSAQTLRLQVPRVDWAPIIAGVKTQLRRNGRGAPQLHRVSLPRPIVIYSVQPFRTDPETRLAVIESVSKEPLGAITPEGLAAEGFESLGEFRRYWMERHSRGQFKPLGIVNVYTLRPWRAGDREHFGEVLLSFLYGPWL